eukprot:CAMPEP_0113314856 /NCGR_PEP_ID=MMETSP0010_2-20120614/10748_1 /TAXON_ID=216773 ORGANISM="Corethron hystrix, Strain 308" /NCGR_SAMPLE_ID=MMETSP0010_2 /ASSEMBLY_ACC=CAM_ASM_000155 /LENGTH=67 /DNA_ID=CAMNT_0000171223 /DNA_START=225 /DNA_END=431 /DNA_ORIENTATION=+ /assembly_acc=CAM_ASM_000155
MGEYDDDDWDELPEEVVAAAKVLGYTQAMWDGDIKSACEDKDWEELSEEEKKAATTLGYTPESWDAE